MRDLTWLWRIIVGAAVTGIMAMSAWSMASIVDFPKEYAPKKDLQEQRKENREDHKDIMKKIDRILDRL